MGILFLLFPMPTHFLGDGYTVIANLASSSGTFIKWSEKGITFILIAIQSLLGPKNQNTSLWAFRIVSVLSGLISIWFFFMIAQITGADKFRKTLIFLASLLSGILLLFFGYAENYPLLWVALTGFTFFGIRYLNENGNLLWPALFLAFGLFIHLEMGTLLPAYVYLILAKGGGLRFYRRFQFAFWIAASALVIAGIVLFARKFTTNLYFENIFLPLIDGKPNYPEYALLSLPHLSDIINLLLLLSPLIFLLIFLSIRNIPAALKSKCGRFLILSALFSFLFLAIIDPMLGLPRDWDLFSVSAYALTLLLILHISENGLGAIKRIILPATIYLLAALLPYLVTNLKTKESIAYAQYTIDLDIPKSYPAYSIMLHYYGDRNDTVQGEMLYAKYHPQYVTETKYRLAEGALSKGSIPEAVEIVNTISPDKFSWRYHNLLSFLYFAKDDTGKALEESDKALQLNNYNSELFANRAKILNGMRKIDEALIYLDKAYQLDRRNTDILEGLTSLNSFIRKPDQIIRYAGELAVVDSTSFKAYYYLTGALAMTKKLDQAEIYYAKYLKYGTNDSLFERRRTELGQLIANMKGIKR